MKPLAAILALVFAQALAGCDGAPVPLPTSPSAGSVTIPPDPTPPPAVSGERWNLITTVKSITGTEACVSEFSRLVGRSNDWVMAIQRSGETIHLSVFDPADPSDHYEYDGTVVADDVSAVAAASAATFVCAGARLDSRAEQHVSGRFSGDGGAFTGDEVISHQLTSGEVVAFRFEWRALRQ